MKQIGSSLKPYLRWVILGGVLFFLGKALNANAAEVAAIRIDNQGWIYLEIALILTIIASLLAEAVGVGIASLHERNISS